tara:strand:- start:4447 stop:5784 length:1338 start_codon:yes stop_codon:yes gene_type:complete
MSSLPCYYAIGGINFKNGFVTSCPTQHEKMEILDDSYLPSEFFNNQQFRNHRKQLMSGTWCKGCNMCEHVEVANAGQSMRQEYDVDLQYYNPATGETAFEGLKTVEMRFSNSCNMACLHCSSVFSSGWMSKLKRYTPTEEDHELELHQLTGHMHRSSVDDDYSMSISTERALEIVDDLNTNFPNLERVDFAGGEVLYQKQFFPTLEKLSEHPNASNMKIIFHSNFNADFDAVELSMLLQRFGDVNIQMSIDAGPRLYPYFRQGNWEKLKQNIAYFKSVDNNHCEMNVVYTTGTYQLMEIKDAFLNFLELDIDYIDASIVYTPAYLNPSLMLLKHRSYVLNDIEDTRNEILKIAKARRENINITKHLKSYQPTPTSAGDVPFWSDIISAFKGLEAIRKYILNTTSTEAEWKSFMKYIEKTDKIWKHNFNDHIKTYQYVNGEVIRNV